ncbi:hypothetical protein MIND_00148800 [Mycena indigotica]|uniref:Uncharacterized protein n=1 Tax=Mycena indigotica TaxID=2126181 RepID=A0A8H6TGK5_9AGAR|nr:uncharacterized protein MIND_00148800 [Mycena indigotica]KAF7316301.1 hypothetical protein MIND_00148800 [Mycena indigotica]
MLQLLLVLALCIFRVQTTLVNITIDDTDPHAWTWKGDWRAYESGNTVCNDGCWAHPDPSKVYGSSWHDGQFSSGTFTAQGVAVYIYGVDVSQPQGPPGNVSFFLKNSAVSGYHVVGTAPGYTYNSLYFSAQALDASSPFTVQWTLRASVGGVGGLGLFDYAVVTVERPDPPPPAPPPPPPSPTGNNADAAATSSVRTTTTPTTHSSTSEKRDISPSSGTSAGSGSTVGTSTTKTSSITSIAQSTTLAPVPSNLIFPTPHRSQTGYIVGGVVGGIIFLVILVGGLCYWKRRSHHPQTALEPAPFQSQSQSFLLDQLKNSKLEASMSTHSLNGLATSNISTGSLQGREAEFERRLRDLEARALDPPAYS